VGSPQVLTSEALQSNDELMQTLLATFQVWETLLPWVWET
jgi:hypothetical protein